MFNMAKKSLVLFACAALISETKAGGYPTCEYGVKVNGVPVTETPINDRVSLETGTGLALHDIPSVFRSMTGFFPQLPVSTGSEISLTCCGSTTCDFFISVYHCPPCSSGMNGGLPTILPDSGFDAGSCAPKFSSLTSYPSGIEHPMTTFHKKVRPGQPVTVPALTSDASYVVIFGQQNAPCPLPWCVRPHGPHHAYGVGCRAHCAPGAAPQP